MLGFPLREPCSAARERFSNLNSDFLTKWTCQNSPLKSDEWTPHKTANGVVWKFYIFANQRKVGQSVVRLLRQDPLEAILVIFGHRALIFFCLKALWKIWKMKPLLCACAVVITLKTQKCRKRAPRSVKFNVFINCDTQKRFSQNERKRADVQNVASDFFNFCLGI